MYSFRDTTDTGPVTTRPAEAMQINGQWLEDVVPGYRTLYTKGRELLAPEVETEDVGVRDGSLLRSKRYPARTITVGYQLVAPDSAAFRQAYNRLAAALDVQEARLIFADEPDKFFVGTPSAVESTEYGKNAVKGEFSILCVDPFKYSVQEYTAAPESDGEFRIDYGGSVPSAPILTASFPGTEDANGNITGSDCGFVVFMGQNGEIIQLGDPDEMEGEDLPESQTLVNKVFQTYGTATAAEWPVNVGRTSSTSVSQAGSVAILTDEKGEKLIGAGKYGTGSNYHGPSITRTLPADASGHVGAKFFRLTYRQRMCMGAGSSTASQRGVFQVLCVNKVGSERKVIAGLSVFKPHAGNQATINLYVNNKNMDAIHIDISHGNRFFGYGSNSALTTTISKQGRYVSFNVAGLKRKFFDEGIANLEMHELTFLFGQYATQPALTMNGLYEAKLIMDHCVTWQDIPNKFSAGDAVQADCSTGEITLNGISAPELGALGNDWETFRLRPGSNSIGTAWSDWAQTSPEFAMRYREVWL